MAKKRARDIDLAASQLLERYDLLQEPVDIEAVAARLGASVRRDELDDDVSGFLLVEQGVSTITVNSKHAITRQRFTIAHECGHLHLHASGGDRLWVDRATFYRAVSNPGEERQEIDANQFAAGLLMPEALVKAHVSSRSQLSEFEISMLASKFQVSERAMTVRLISLKLFQSVVD